MHTEGAQPRAARARLKAEIALNREFRGDNEAAFLALVWTWQRLESLGRRFFPRYGITDVQFNVLMILWDHRDRTLHQRDVARLLVVNRASAGSVLSRVERAGWVARTRDPEDTRAIRVRLTPSGVRKFKEVRAPYYRLLAKLFQEGDDNDGAIRYFDALRARVATYAAEG